MAYQKSTRNPSWSRLALGVSSLSLAMAMSAGAMAADTGGIETVTVTAQFQAQNIQATPLSITAVTGQDLTDRGINDLSQLSSVVPGLTLNKTPAAFGSGVQVYIRGVGQYDTAFAAEPGVGMYIDDLYYGTLFGSSLELYDLNRVEVLRGPQGVLGGKNNIGGSIKLISAKPQGDNSGYLEASYGTRNERVFRGMADLSIVPNKLFLRVSAVSRNQDGYVNVIDYACRFPAGTGPTDSGGGGGVDPVSGVPYRQLPVLTTRPDCKDGTQGGTNVQGARAALRWVITNSMEDTASVDVLRDNSEPQADTLLAVDPIGLPFSNVYVDRNGHPVAVPAATFYGLNSDGNVRAVSSPPPWPAIFNGYNTSVYGIPWDQRFEANPFKVTYGTYTSEIACDNDAPNPPGPNSCQTGHPNSIQHYTDGAMVHAWGASNIYDWDISDNVHFKNITGWRFYKAANSNDTDVSPMSFQLTTSYPQNREFQEEARFTGNLFDRFDWTLGGFYYHRINIQRGPVDIDAIPLRFEQHDKYVTSNKSIYFTGTYHILDNLEVFGGIRYTKESKTYFFNHVDPIPGVGGGFFRDTVDPACTFVASSPACPANAPLVPHTSKTARPDWRGGVDYHVTDDAMLYVQYSTGYRTGGTNSRPFDPAQLTSYGPESLSSWEVGAKTDWWDHRVRVNLSLYKSDYKHTITPLAETDALGLPFVDYVNLGSSTRKGFELETTFAPIDNLLMDFNYSLVRTGASPLPGAPAGWLDGCSAAGYAANLCDLNPLNNPLPASHTGPGTIRAGSAPILYPERTAHFDIQYIWHMEDMGTLTPRLDFDYQSTIYQSANNNPYTEISARGLWNGRLTWDAPQGGWQASLLVNNLADKKYFIDVFDLAAFNFGSVEAQPAPGREWLLTIRKTF